MPPKGKGRRNPKRAAVKYKWDEEYLLTNRKSPLVNIDLVKLFARPEAWDVLDESEKQELIDLLPPHARPAYNLTTDEKIPPPPESFLRYSNHWRDSVRQFQIDLENGRYDPEWQRQAQEAVKERERGEFDDFKEREFEEFWGQKQKFDRTQAAGESSLIKLQTLVEKGVVLVGDVWKLSRAFNTPSGKLLVEKEAKIMELDGTNMTCIVPAGQRTFLPQVPDSDFEALLEAYRPPDSERLTVKSDKPEVSERNGDDDIPEDDARQTRGSKKRKSNAAVGRRKKRQVEKQNQSNGTDKGAGLSERPKRRRGRPRKNQYPEAPAEEQGKKDDVVALVSDIQNQPQEKTSTEDVKIETGDGAEDAKPERTSSKDTDEKPPTNEPNTTRTVPEITTQGEPPSTDTPKQEESPHQKQLPSTPPSLGEIELAILWNVNGATNLCNKMIAVDGRVTHIPNGNAWKEIRSIRKNQDMGTLWEVRQAWYVKQLN